ncbi:ricin-type beta-trefoil lectin domain protein [Streptomyces sp. NPDC048385]|uniref:ricin-type beta-trefoil lectin domain protein n=1 Tax=unclassified Streptomyces TaxID=2593676 RepID=UPI00341C9926
MRRTATRHNGRNGKWVVVVNNHNTTDTPLSLHFNSGTPVRATQAVRTSVTADRAEVEKPSVSSGTVSTTYVFDQKGHGSSAVPGALVGTQSGKCLDVSGQATADGSKVILYSCNSGTNEAWTRQ